MKKEYNYEEQLDQCVAIQKEWSEIQERIRGLGIDDEMKESCYDQGKQLQETKPDLFEKSLAKIKEELNANDTSRHEQKTKLSKKNYHTRRWS